jgi:hypothetical protein
MGHEARIAHRKKCRYVYITHYIRNKTFKQKKAIFKTLFRIMVHNKSAEELAQWRILNLFIYKTLRL